MPPRPIASLAHALGAAPDQGAALLALGETLADIDRGALLALFPYDARSELLRERLAPDGTGLSRTPADASLEHLPSQVRQGLLAGARFIELADRSADYGRLLGFPSPMDGTLSLRGLVVEGHLVAVLALFEPRRIFGARALDRFAPAVELFDLAVARFWEREAREEAVRTLEEVTQHVHGAYVKRLAMLERELDAARRTPAAGVAITRPAGEPTPNAARAERVTAERQAAQQAEAVRRAERRAQRLEEQLAAGASTLEQTQVELLRRGETLRHTERTLYLIDRVLSLDASAHDPRQLVDGLLALVGDDMQAQRCSLMLRAPEPDQLYLAAARGLSPHVAEGARVRMGEGVSGRVAASREPLLVRDVRDAGSHPLLRDQYFTSGSFISFPLVYHDGLVGVVNLTNRTTSEAGYTDADVERVRLLGLVIALVATHARLAERLAAHLEVA
jgi:putative methionine-R-sulfoxide reductase with GAF domain